MKLRDLRVLRGPNYWSIRRHNIIQLTLDLETLEYKPSDELPGFYEGLTKVLPSLYNHRCSPGVPGGFFQRVKEGTWMGHVVEHAAIELQNLAGMDVGFGQTRGTGEEGVYHVAFEYEEEESGKYAGAAALELVEALIDGRLFDVEAAVAEITRLWQRGKLGPTTASLVTEARQRNIPVLAMDDGSLIQLGYGNKQRRIESSLTSKTSVLAVDIAGDKERTKTVLRAANLPVPFGEAVSDEETLKEVVDAVGYPLVIKPLSGNHGKGATINIQNWEAALDAFRRAKAWGSKVMVEQFVTGHDFRVLVVNNRFVAAALRTPAAITGDGVRTVQQLIDAENADSRRGNGHENLLTKITVDDTTRVLLQEQRCTLDSILPEGKILYLKNTANLSTGGTATDVTDEVHLTNIACFERIARSIGLDVCGIDVMAPTLSTPLSENGGAVLEVNAAPGLRMHLAPSSGKPRNVAKPIIDGLFAPKENGRIPIIAVTGTNGKTTTTRLLAHIVKEAGYFTGFTTTDGVYINGETVLRGDCSGPQSAQMVLKDPAVEFAVLETARGGILRSGLAFDQCDCAVVTNVAEDHLGLNGIDTIEKLARVKSVVPESVQPNGYAVLNADDDHVYAMKDKLTCKVALYSLHPDSVRIEQHCATGGLAAVCENGFLLIRNGNQYIPVEEVENVPITFGGKASFNIANALAAVLATYTSRIRLKTIRQALASFVPGCNTTPGRLNIYSVNSFTLVVDYAHNPHGVRALGSFIKTLDGFKSGIITAVGDRRDEDIVALGMEAARIFDEIIIRHDEDMRGRTCAEVDALLREGVTSVDPQKPMRYVGNECDAVTQVIREGQPGSVIVVLVENVTAVTACIQQHQEVLEAQLVPQNGR